MARIVASRTYGTAVCNGVTLHVVDVRLRGASIHLMCVTPEPGDYVVEGPVTIFGEDGRGLLQSSNVPRTESRRGYITVWLPMRVLMVVEEPPR